MDISSIFTVIRNSIQDGKSHIFGKGVFKDQLQNENYVRIYATLSTKCDLKSREKLGFTSTTTKTYPYHENIYPAYIYQTSTFVFCAINREDQPKWFVDPGSTIHIAKEKCSKGNMFSRYGNCRSISKTKAWVMCNG
jgi:hypothetical protein